MDCPQHAHSAGSPVMGVRGKYESPVRDHKKATAERWIDPNTRDSAGSPVMGVRGKYEGPIRDHKKATAKRWIDPNMRDSAGSPVMGVRGKYDFRYSGAQRQKGSRGNLSPCPIGAVRRTGGSTLRGLGSA